MKAVSPVGVTTAYVNMIGPLWAQRLTIGEEAQGSIDFGSVKPARLEQNGMMRFL